MHVCSLGLTKAQGPRKGRPRMSRRNTAIPGKRWAHGIHIVLKEGWVPTCLVGPERTFHLVPDEFWKNWIGELNPLFLWGRETGINHCCCCSVAQPCLTLCDPMDYSTPGFPVLYHLLEFAQTHAHWFDLSKHLILCYPLHLHSIFLSIWVFSSKLVLHIRWPKY